MKFLRQDRIGISIIRKSSPFVLFVAMLMIAAILQGCDKLGLIQNTNAATESNSGTQTWAASALKTPTRPPSTNTPTPSSTPTETPTVTPTQTPSPTPTPEIPFLITQFSLNPDRQYTFVITENGTRYLRDEHNQALMLKYIVVEEAGQPIGEWVDTSLEEKYGHLVPVDARSFVEIFYMNYFTNQLELHGNPNFMSTGTAAWSTGNSRTERVYYPSLGREIIHVVTLVVYRDQSGNLQPLETIQTIDPESPGLPLATAPATDPENPQIGIFGCGDEFSGTDDATSATMCMNEYLGYVDSIDTLVSVYGTPGLMMQVTFDVVKPNTPPLDSAHSLEIAHYALWQQYRQYWQTLSDNLRYNDGSNPNPQIPVALSRLHLYLSMDQINNLFSNSAP